jgi:flagellar basal-body rod modification protein FlgD
MEITRANTGIGAAGAGGGEAVDREQALKNSMAQIQARYGEKPKEARVAKKALDKDDFMRIMITEMRHQDPTKPMDSDRMATQMAQITSVEQLKNVSNAIEKMADKNNASDRLAMSGMIGRTVTVDKGRFTHQKGTISPINFELPEDATKIKVTILNEQGEEVATRDLEPMKSGQNVYSWDGVTASNTQTGSGTYLVRVDAENAKGGKIKIDPISKERIVGVSFEGGDTHFLVGDSKTPQKVAFKNVIRIETDAGASKARTSASDSASAGGEETAGSANALPVGLQEKLKAELVEAGREGDVPTQAVVAEGFPNGLND